MIRNFGLLLLTAGVVLGVLLWTDRPGRGPVAPIAEAGDPEFGLGERFDGLTFVDILGGTRTLDAFAADAPLIVFVRDALCPVSRRYGPETARIARQYEARGVKTLLLNVSPLDTREDMAADIDRYGLEGTYAVDHR